MAFLSNFAPNHFPYWISRESNRIEVILQVRGPNCAPRRFYHDELLRAMAESCRRAANAIAEEVIVPEYIDLTSATPPTSPQFSQPPHWPIEVLDLTNDDPTPEESSPSESVTLGSQDTVSSISMDDEQDPEYIPLPDEDIPHAIKRRRLDRDQGRDPQF